MAKSRMKEKGMQVVKESAIATGIGGGSFLLNRYLVKWIGPKVNVNYGEMIVSWVLYAVNSVGAYFIQNKPVKNGIIAGSGIQAFLSTGATLTRNTQNPTVKNFFLNGDAEIETLSGDDVRQAIEDRAAQIANQQVEAKLNALSVAGLIRSPEEMKSLAAPMDGEESLYGNEPDEYSNDLSGEFDLSGEYDLD